MRLLYAMLDLYLLFMFASACYLDSSFSLQYLGFYIFMVIVRDDGVIKKYGYGI